MKKKYFFCTFFVVILMSACGVKFVLGNGLEFVLGNGLVTTHTRSITDYRKIKSEGSFNVLLIPHTEDSITIKGEKNIIPYVLTEVKNGILTIKFQKGVSIRATKRLQVTVPVKNIDAISIRGSGNVKSEHVIISDDIFFDISGSGDMNVRVKATTVSISVRGSGNVAIAGETGTLDADIAGSGYINAYNLGSNVVMADIRGSGNIKVTVRDTLKASIRGSGDIFYKGNPTIDKAISGSGKIQATEMSEICGYYSFLLLHVRFLAVDSATKKRIFYSYA